MLVIEGSHHHSPLEQLLVVHAAPFGPQRFAAAHSHAPFGPHVEPAGQVPLEHWTVLFALCPHMPPQTRRGFTLSHAGTALSLPVHPRMPALQIGEHR
jgi:hypothetical protein